MQNEETFRFTSKFKGRKVPLRLRVAHFCRAVLFAPLFILHWRSLLGKRPTNSKHVVTLLNDITNASLGRGLSILNHLICVLRIRDTRLFDREFTELVTPSNRTITKEQIASYSEELSLNGFLRIEKFLTKEQSLVLYESAIIQRGSSNDFSRVYDRQSEWEGDALAGPRFDFVESDVSNLQNIDRYAKNDVIQLIARKYLGCKPILVSKQIWTTRQPNLVSAEILEKSAMAYHCDSDFVGFLKFFVLLTDVSKENGPFVFVQKSHTGDRHVSGRMPDIEILSNRDVELFGTGFAGDLIVADTRGWHKASPPAFGTRTMLQLVYSSSYFGGLKN
jgi:hypothetical protein